jgi:hypothetical protein
MYTRIIFLVVCLLLLLLPPLSNGGDKGGAKSEPAGKPAQTGSSSAYSGFYRNPSKVIEMRNKKVTHAQRKEAAARFKASREAVRARQGLKGTADPKGGVE